MVGLVQTADTPRHFQIAPDLSTHRSRVDELGVLLDSVSLSVFIRSHLMQSAVARRSASISMQELNMRVRDSDTQGSVG